MIYGRINSLIKENSIRKLIALVVLVTGLSLVPVPPTGQTALADVEKPPSKMRVVPAKSTLTVQTPKTTPVEPVQAPVAAEPVQSTAPVQTPVIDTSTQPTDHNEMMAAAGISESDYSAVDYIISHESGWNPDATNASSGAHGLPQALPYSKTGCGWDDGICQLIWANSYAVSRYGGWQQAYNYWVANHYW